MSISLFPKSPLFRVSKLMNKVTKVAGVDLILRMHNMDSDFSQFLQSDSSRDKFCAAVYSMMLGYQLGLLTFIIWNILITDEKVLFSLAIALC